MYVKVDELMAGILHWLFHEIRQHLRKTFMHASICRRLQTMEDLSRDLSGEGQKALSHEGLVGLNPSKRRRLSLRNDSDYPQTIPLSPL